MRRVLLVLSLLWSPLVSAAAPAVMLVWGGGATREEADAALKDYQQRFKPMRGALLAGGQAAPPPRRRPAARPCGTASRCGSAGRR